MEHAFTPLISGLISYYIPINNELIKMQIGLLISSLISTLISKNYFKNITNFFRRNNNQVLIESVFEGKKNNIYSKFQEYIIDKFSKKITSSTLIPREGTISLQVNNDLSNHEILDEYNGHKIIIKFSEQESGNSDDKKTFLKKNIIKITSKTASQELLKTYVIGICRLEKTLNKILTIWRPIITKNNRDELLSWESTKCKTNKSFENTIVSENVNNKFFKDIDWFSNNDEWYSNKGLPYKRGYLLHGPPGTGKTSLIKAIANSYNLDVFSIDFDTVKTNHDLINLMLEINFLSQNKKYILALEDLDRSDILKERYYREDCKISKDCLLNVIDGIIETYGRILIITCNDVNFIKNFPALIRPGRIDSVINIDYCDSYQISKLVENFYNIKLEKTPKIKSDITPAQFIKLMQQHSNDNKFILDNIENISPELLHDEIEPSNFNLKKYTKNNRNTYKIKDTLQSLKEDLKYFNRQIKRQESSLRRSNNIIQKSKKQIPIIKEKIVKEKDKEKQIKELSKEKLKKEKQLQKLVLKNEKMNTEINNKNNSSNKPVSNRTVITRSMKKNII